ncbi:Cof-type HAD-IIB family hydrolase [Cellulophaga sp. Hel_I_12]|uniref:Cof-type HAD-IIB family hydrolase n=1 Tax=Cellulophaga sp. Hel_I_12 TaxID=1249972 RepID=UPI0006468ECE|nr:Cof-type HAD-IIB family hydrolase [Cellulophaga sp. Hel_I_12]
MNYKLLCSDLDGTLLSTKSDVSAFTISEISRIKDKLRVILVSARMPKAMTYLQKSLGIEKEPMICYNGALVVHGENEISSVTIPLTILNRIHQLAAVHGIKLGLYYKNEWFVEEDSERVAKEINYTKNHPEFRSTTDTLSDWEARQISGAHKVMLMGAEDTTDSLFQDLQDTLSDAIAIYRSNETLIEIAPKSVSKLTAIQLLLAPNETLDQVIAFGDNYNDFDMLKYAGCGVAVANARDTVKEIANYITAKNTDDGVARFIKEQL